MAGGRGGAELVGSGRGVDCGVDCGGWRRVAAEGGGNGGDSVVDG